jgi:hypothetical protein
MNDVAVFGFASRSILVHAARGAVGIASLAGAIIAGRLEAGIPESAAALLLIGVALVAFRGRPVCWTAGLIETIMRSRRSS